MSEQMSSAAHSLMVELLYESPPAVQPEAIALRVNDVLPGTFLQGAGDDSMMFVHGDIVVDRPDGSLPIATSVIVGDPSARVQNRDLSQTWTWQQAEEVLDRCPYSLVVAEMMAGGAQRRDRLIAFRKTLDALIEQTQPVATWWPLSAQALPPSELEDNQLVGSINVRMYDISNEPGVLVMDTLGLTAFELPDLQCHFQGIEPGAMARVLYNTAAYLFEQGDVIENGQTIPGPDGDEHWRCQHEDALIGPPRVVLDIDPGDPFAAGDRSR